MRPLAVAPSGLSPLEYESYHEQLNEFERSGPSNGDAHVIWKWILGRCLDEPVESRTQADILAFFKTPPTAPALHTFVALLRLLAQSRSSKHLTRDHVFIQTTPVTLSPVAPHFESAPTLTNPLRKTPFVSPTTASMRTTAFSPPASPISQASSSRSAPPLPTKRLSTPIAATSKNPFKNRTPSANDPRPLIAPPQHPRSISSPAVPAHDTPPLPPRPRSAKIDTAFSRMDTPPPPPPSRRLSSQHPPSSSSISIISSSSPVESRSPSNFAAPPFRPSTGRTNSRTKLDATSHIGPDARLRSDNTGSSSGGNGGTKVSSSSPRRTGSLNGDPTTRSEEVEGRAALAVGLGRSRTLGSKPIPPPPKRRPGSLTGADPFAESISTTRRSPFAEPTTASRNLNRSSKEFYSTSPVLPTPSPTTSSSLSAAATLTTHSTRAAKEISAALSNSSKDLGNLLQQSGKSSEEWFRGARNGIRVAGVGGGNGRREEREKLVMSDREDEPDDEDELEAQRTGESMVVDDREGRRVEVERSIKSESEIGWSKLS